MRSLRVPMLLLATALVATGPAPASHAALDDGRVVPGPGRVVPLGEILAAVRRIVTGTVIDIELETTVESEDPAAPVHRWVYEVEVLTRDDRLVELEFDAKTGELLEVEGAPWPADVPRPAR